MIKQKARMSNFIAGAMLLMALLVIAAFIFLFLR
jgi:hypothetical protein